MSQNTFDSLIEVGLRKDSRNRNPGRTSGIRTHLL